MRVQVIKKPEYLTLCHVQIKKWWFPFWYTVHVGPEKECLTAVKNYMEHGTINTILFEGNKK